MEKGMFVTLCLRFGFYIKKFIHLFLTVLALCCCKDFSLVELNRGCSLVVVRRLLIVVVSVVGEYRR